MDCAAVGCVIAYRLAVKSTETSQRSAMNEVTRIHILSARHEKVASVWYLAPAKILC